MYFRNLRTRTKPKRSTHQPCALMHQYTDSASSQYCQIGPHNSKIYKLFLSTPSSLDGNKLLSYGIPMSDLFKYIATKKLKQNKTNIFRRQCFIALDPAETASQQRIRKINFIIFFFSPLKICKTNITFLCISSKLFFKWFYY